MRTVQLQGLGTRGRAQHAHLGRRVLARATERTDPEQSNTTAIRAPSHPSASTPRCTDGETEARRAGEDEGWGLVRRWPRVGAGRLGADAARQVPEAPRRERAGWDLRRPRRLLRQGRTPLGRDARWVGFRGPAAPSTQNHGTGCAGGPPTVGRAGGVCAARIPGPSPPTPCDPECGAAAFSRQ